MAGRSAISQWKAFSTERIYSKVGGDLSAYDVAAKLASLQPLIPPDVHKRLRKLVGKVPWTTKLSMLLAVDGWRDAGLFDADYDPHRQAVIVAGHNLNALYQFNSRIQFEEEPDFIDGMMSLYGLDTDHAGCVSEVLQARGPIYTVGAACASGNIALRARRRRDPPPRRAGGARDRRRARVLADRAARDGADGRHHLPELQRPARPGEPAVRHASRRIRAGARRRRRSCSSRSIVRWRAVPASTPRCSASRPTPTATICRSHPRRARPGVMTQPACRCGLAPEHDRLRQCPRHVDAARRPHRAAVDQARVRSARAQAQDQRAEVDARPHLLGGARGRDRGAACSR